MRSLRPRHVATAALLFVAACTHDFDSFQASQRGGDAGRSDSSASDGGDDVSDTQTIDTAEASCTPQESCLVDAQTCAAPCDSAETSCVSGCGNPGCKSKCHDTANACRASCATACVTCTTDAGCAAPTECTAAAK